MIRYKIPASITLAQGLLESGAGTSILARKANNHFGIKCGRAWKGPYILQDDDARNEKFRKYRSVEESYEDHSRFLQQARYSSLFDLSMKDYKGWARGLKRCGYATNPCYASLLIDLIERYDLDQFDKHKSSFALSHPNFGGESYSDYGLVLTPLDFAWYLDGFSDTDSQREVFFSYYDSLMNEEEKSDEERYLEVLGLKKGATRDEIQKAYKDIVQRFHPDRISSLGLDPLFTSFANAQMQRANEAYDALKKMLTS